VILAAWRDGARFDGWSEYFSFDRWVAACATGLAETPVDLAWYTTRERDYGEVLPWDHLDSGLDRDWLWEDWQSAVSPAGADEVEDCRVTPCYECGVCPAMGTEIQTGPTGERLDGRAPASRASDQREIAMGGVIQNGGKPVTTQHLLVRYAKRGKMRFASHLDVARAFERGVRRAGLPIAYSVGFTPHPKISYAGGVPTGVASEAEYLSLTLTTRAEADDVRELLNAALPDGIDVIAVTEDSGGLPASRLTASEWQVALPGLPADDVVPVVQKFLALTEAPVERLTSKGMRRMDARAAVVSLDVIDDASAGSALRMVVRHVVPSVRPDDVLNALRDVSDVFPTEQPLMTRLEQGSLGESGVVKL